MLVVRYKNGDGLSWWTGDEVPTSRDLVSVRAEDKELELVLQLCPHIVQTSKVMRFVGAEAQDVLYALTSHHLQLQSGK